MKFRFFFINLLMLLLIKFATKIIKKKLSLMRKENEFIYIFAAYDGRVIPLNYYLVFFYFIIYNYVSHNYKINA